MRQKGFTITIIFIIIILLSVLGYFAYTKGYLSSYFNFKNDKNTYEGKFCGGIAANLPEFQCPEGYYCKLDSKNPDTSGVCVKNKW